MDSRRRTRPGKVPPVKFPQFPIGQHFEYQGETLVKVGPMTACNERGGNTRLIPRSAVVVAAAAPPAPAAGAPVDARVQAALAGFEARWRGALAGLDEPSRNRLEQALTGAQAELLEALGLGPSP